MLCVQWRTALYNNHEYRMSIIFADPFRSFARNKIITPELARACATAQDDPQARFKHLPLEGSEGMPRDEDEQKCKRRQALDACTRFRRSNLDGLHIRE